MCARAVYRRLQDDGTAAASDGEEAHKQAALRRYNQFREVYRELLDPALEEEFEAMRQLGLPTMLINSYGDMEDVCIYQCVWVCSVG